MNPTKYEKRYCEALINFMEQGYSFKAFAGFLGVERQTLYNWCKQYPEFLEAKGIAFSKRVYTLEKTLWTFIHSDKQVPNLTAFIALMNNTQWKRDRKKKDDDASSNSDDVKALADLTRKIKGKD